MKILIAAGGSGGHIFPALALSEKLSRQKDVEIVFVASRRALDRKILRKAPFKKVFLSINPMPYGLSFKIIPFVIKFICDLFASAFILAVERPKIAVGFGGYTAGSILMLAAVMGIKTIIHEQNLVPGRANKLLDKLVDIAAISFEDSRVHFRKAATVFTGNPLRENIILDGKKNISKFSGFDENRFTILIMGGSQGARSLNALASVAIKGLGDNIKENLQVVHIAGSKDFDTVSNIYKENRVLAKTFSFIENIHDAYRITDLAISRSGAAAVFELSLYGKPMILIPYPFKKNNQRFNARYFADREAAIYKEENSLNSDDFRNLIRDVMDNKDKLKRLSENAKRLSRPDAAERLASEVMKLAGTN
jgi:UDP-N-acetylglucosamine--N-acetylmuramyl-(pentapeptide) pyrophosphoryl-undecaprenol N-acetylglucosamine transferase